MKVNLRQWIHRHCFYVSLLGKEPLESNCSCAPEDISPVNSSWCTPPETSMLVKCMLNSGLTEIRGEHPAETMSRTSGNKIWRTVCTNRSGYLARSWVGGREGREWNSTSKLSCLSLLFNTEQVEAGHMGQKSVSAQSDYARQLCLLLWIYELYWATPKQA